MSDVDMVNGKNNESQSQVVFVDPNWLRCLDCKPPNMGILDFIMGIGQEIHAVRRKCLERLQAEGFQIVFDEKSLPEDAIYLSSNRTLIDDREEEVALKKAINARVVQAAGENANIPYSLEMEEFLENPFELPVILKNKCVDRGVDKFIIRTPEQLDIVRKFYSKYSSNWVYKNVFDGCVFEELIETPSEYKTFIRVLMIGKSGEEISTCFRYSLEAKGKTKGKEKGLLEKHFWDKDSEFYLGDEEAFAYYSGGEIISFNKPCTEPSKQQMFEIHGIDPENPTIPKEVLEVAREIAQKCYKEFGIIMGLDFIQNVTNR
ncbi:MAG: hypothetical protein FWC68_03770 [Oscillospiraceae bacterium]|nr:hypothetical protein [Oscillospiraceae bacterium]